MFQDLNIKEKVRVQVELCKVNGETSEPQVGYLTVKGGDCLGMVVELNASRKRG